MNLDEARDSLDLLAAKFTTRGIAEGSDVMNSLTADERLALVRVRVERAKEHFTNLDAEIRRFLDGHDPRPYIIGTQNHPKTGCLTYYVVSVSDVPQGIAVLAGDVLQNCRTALDHLAYQLVLVGNPGTPPSTQTSFPIFDSATAYESQKAGRVKGMRQDAVEYFDLVKPYKGGNTPLWVLHRLNIIDKHRLLLSATISNQGRSVTKGERIKLDEFFGTVVSDQIKFAGASRENWNLPLKAGDVLSVEPVGSEVNQDMEVATEIAFAEPEVIEREAVRETLNSILRSVDAVAVDCRRFLA